MVHAARFESQDDSDRQLLCVDHGHITGKLRQYNSTDALVLWVASALHAGGCLYVVNYVSLRCATNSYNDNRKSPQHLSS